MKKIKKEKDPCGPPAIQKQISSFLSIAGGLEKARGKVKE